MFILRKFTEAESLEMNFWLGDTYSVIYKELNPIEFKKLEDSGHTMNEEKCYAVISCHHGKTSYPLFANQRNYIHTSDGTRYDCLN